PELQRVRELPRRPPRCRRGADRLAMDDGSRDRARAGPQSCERQQPAHDGKWNGKHHESTTGSRVDRSEHDACERPDLRELRDIMAITMQEVRAWLDPDEPNCAAAARSLGPAALPLLLEL